MKRKTTKLLSILLILIITVSSITACGDKSDKKSGSKANSAASQFVGRWELGYYTNSNDESFDKYYVVEKQEGGYAGYIELYSNGTGITTHYYDKYYNDEAAVFEWEIVHSDFEDADVLIMYYATFEDGKYIAHETVATDITRLKDTYIDSEKGVKTLGYTFYASHEPYFKITDKKFKDNPDLGCTDAFKSIDEYRSNKE